MNRLAVRVLSITLLALALGGFRGQANHAPPMASLLQPTNASFPGGNGVMRVYRRGYQEASGSEVRWYLDGFVNFTISNQIDPEETADRKEEAYPVHGTGGGASGYDVLFPAPCSANYGIWPVTIEFQGHYYPKSCRLEGIVIEHWSLGILAALDCPLVGSTVLPAPPVGYGTEFVYEGSGEQELDLNEPTGVSWTNTVDVEYFSPLVNCFFIDVIPPLAE